MLNNLSTIVENDNNTITKYTPVYPIYKWENGEFFSLFRFLPAFVKLDGHEYITYPLRPDTEINLISISNVDDTTSLILLNNKIKVKNVCFYIGNDPFGTNIPYTPEFEFKEDPNGISMKMILDEPVESHGPLHIIKGRMKGEARLDIGTIKVWMEDVSVTDDNGEDLTDQFHFTGYTVEATKVLTTSKLKI